MKKKILITGANGFVGISLLSKVYSEYEFYAVVRNIPSVKIEGVNYLIADLNNPYFITVFPSQVDVIIHLAQSKRYRDFPDGANDMRSINIDSTSILLDWARNAGVKHYLFTSTANVYKSTDGLFDEMSEVEPCSFYASSKLSAEYIVSQYSGFFQTTILRLFTIYGPNQKGMLISNIIDRIIQGQKIVLAQSVGPFLTPVYIDDLVEVFECFLKEIEIEYVNSIYNVCGDEKINLREIIAYVEKKTSLNANIDISSEKVLHLAGSNSKLKGKYSNLSFLKFSDVLDRLLDSHTII